MVNIKIHKAKMKGGRKQEIRSCRKLLREAKRGEKKQLELIEATRVE